MPNNSEIQTEIQHSWDEFVKEYNFILKFGTQALQDQLNKKAAAEGNTFGYNAQQVKELIPSIMTQIDDKLTELLDQRLKMVYQRISQYQTPRADNVPKETNKNLLGIEEGIVQRRRQQFEAVPWGDKFDIASNTNIQDAFDDYRELVEANQAEAGNRKEYTPALKMKMDGFKQKLREDAELQLRLRATPPTSAPKPGPGGIVR